MGTAHRNGVDDFGTGGAGVGGPAGGGLDAVLSRHGHEGQRTAEQDEGCGRAGCHHCRPETGRVAFLSRLTAFVLWVVNLG